MSNNSWYDTLIEKRRAGTSHCFVLHFDINGYTLLRQRKNNEYYPLLAFLKELFSRWDMIIHYNISGGIKFLLGNEDEFKAITGFQEQAPDPLAVSMGITTTGLPKAVSPALSLIEKALTDASKKIAVIIDYAETVFPSDIGAAALNQEIAANIVTVRRWAKDPWIGKNHIIILLTENLTELHPSLRASDSGIESILIQKPDAEERETYINYYLANEGNELADGLSPRKLALTAAGLSLRQIENIFLEAKELWSPISLPMVKKRKCEILEKQHKGEGLRFVEPIFVWDTVGGLKKNKGELMEVAAAIENGDWKQVPMGILFVGPHGTGKSHVAQVLAKEIGFNFVELGQIKDKYVGETGKNLAKVFLSVKSSAPIVWFIDEIDQILGQRNEASTDSGVNREYFGDFLRFMSDPDIRGKVLIIAATNRPDLMDPAMKRPGRFDLKMPFLFPTNKEIEDIFRAMLVKYDYKCGITNFSSFSKGPFLDIFNKPAIINGSDIEPMMRHAYIRSVRRGGTEIQEEDIRWGINEHIPTHDLKVVNFQTMLALKECSNRSLLSEFSETLKILQQRQAKKETSAGGLMNYN